MIELRGLPYPVSDNRKYVSRTFVKSSQWRQFESDMETYAWKHFHMIREARKRINSDHQLFGHFIIYGTWFNKDGSIKRIDSQNFAKSICDQLAKMLEFDDCQFFDRRETKVTGPRSMTCIISLATPK